jgi:hypothetical protein
MVPVVARLSERQPRLVGAVAFGAAGLLVASAWFFPAIFRGADPVVALLYLFLPCFSATVSGAIFGPRVVAGGRKRAMTGALWGAGASTAALFLFAPLFAAVLSWAERGWTNVLGLALLVLWWSLIAVGWPIACVGALVGWLLSRWSTRDGRDRMDADPVAPLK